jgi:hypothetical protein
MESFVFNMGLSGTECHTTSGIVTHYATTLSSALWQQSCDKETTPCNMIANIHSVSGFVDSVSGFCCKLNNLYSLLVLLKSVPSLFWQQS